MSELQYKRSKDHGRDAGKEEPEHFHIDAAAQSDTDTTTLAFSGDDDFFCIIGISPDASVAEIRSAFRRQARRYHPDKNGVDSKEAALSNFHYIQAAYEVLTDDTRRSLYKKYGHQTFAKVFSDPLLRQHHTSVIFNIMSNLLKPFEYTNAVFKDGQQPDAVLRLLTRKPVVADCVAIACVGTTLLLGLLSWILTLTFGVSLVSGVGFFVSTMLAVLSGVAFAILWGLIVHYCVVHLLVQSILSVVERSQAQHKTSSTTSAIRCSRVVAESARGSESGQTNESTMDQSATKMNIQANGGESGLYEPPTIHQVSHDSLRRRGPATAESANIE